MLPANQTQYRQGDILLVKVTRLPASAVRETNKDRIVLAYGEATGHAHAISSNFAQAFRTNSQRFLEAYEGAVLVHEEHSAIPLAQGTYQIIRQREFTGFKGSQYVED